MRKPLGISLILVAAIPWLFANSPLGATAQTSACPYQVSAISARLSGGAAEAMYALAKLDSSAAAPAHQGASGRFLVPTRNFIDEHILGKIERDRIPSAELCTDAEFIRRVYLDLTGKIPSTPDVRKFLADSDPSKRDRLVDTLVGNPDFIDRWIMWFGDFFKNTIYPVSAQGRNALYRNIRDMVRLNRPYNQVVSEFIRARGDNFSVGPLNYLMKAGSAGEAAELDTIDDISIAVAKNFLGIKSLCISCHRGGGYLNRINLWLSRKTREEFWAQAAFFTQMQIDVRQLPDMMSYRYTVSDDGPGLYDPVLYPDSEYSFRPARRPTEPIRARYIITGAEPQSGETYRQALARMITADPQFARATVNYLWAHFMVTGIVDPPDGFDLARQDPNRPPVGDDPVSRYWRETDPLQPSHPELLNALATQLVASGYDLRAIMKLICKSSTYQLSSSFPASWRPEYARYYARKLPRLMSAEEIHDSIIMATDIKVSYSVYGSNEKVSWAMQLRGPEEPANTDDTGFEALSFLDAFKRGDRFITERAVNRLSVFQPLSLMHSYFVARRVDAGAGGTLTRLLSGQMSDKQIIDELFLATLSRFPTNAERKLALIYLNNNRNEGAEDLLWALTNKLDFVFNY